MNLLLGGLATETLALAEGVQGILGVEQAGCRSTDVLLGPFCLIRHGSISLVKKARPSHRLDRQVFVFVLARGGCGRGASALPLNASEAR